MAVHLKASSTQNKLGARRKFGRGIRENRPLKLSFLTSKNSAALAKIQVLQTINQY